ncbi:MAG: ABC transporter permease subunit [Anaerolineales bacterium]|nr:ABC transporter permease subunit [Anaerolineales bacterium]
MGTASLSNNLSIRDRLRQRLSRPRSLLYMYISPVTAVLIIFFVVPTLIFFLNSFFVGHAFQIRRELTLENYLYTLTSGVYRTVTINALFVGFLTATFSVLLAYPLAYFLAFKVRKGRNIILFLVVISLLSGYLVRVYAWRTFLGKQGIINTFLLWIGVIDEPLLFLLFSRLAVIITLTNIFVPFTVLPILASLANISTDLIEAARDLGAKPFTAFIKVTLPLSLTGVVSGFVYTFVLSSWDYITPELVGGNTGMMIGRSIADQFVRVGNWPRGSSISFVVLGIFVLLFLITRIARKLLRRKPRRNVEASP